MSRVEQKPENQSSSCWVPALQSVLSQLLTQPGLTSPFPLENQDVFLLTSCHHTHPWLWIPPRVWSPSEWPPQHKPHPWLGFSPMDSQGQFPSSGLENLLRSRWVPGLCLSSESWTWSTGLLVFHLLQSKVVPEPLFHNCLYPTHAKMGDPWAAPVLQLVVDPWLIQNPHTPWEMVVWESLLQLFAFWWINYLPFLSSLVSRQICTKEKLFLMLKENTASEEGWCVFS